MSIIRKFNMTQVDTTNTYGGYMTWNPETLEVVGTFGYGSMLISDALPKHGYLECILQSRSASYNMCRIGFSYSREYNDNSSGYGYGKYITPKYASCCNIGTTPYISLFDFNSNTSIEGTRKKKYH